MQQILDNYQREQLLKHTHASVFVINYSYDMKNKTQTLTQEQLNENHENERQQQLIASTRESSQFITHTPTYIYKRMLLSTPEYIML